MKYILILCLCFVCGTGYAKDKGERFIFKDEPAVWLDSNGVAETRSYVSVLTDRKTSKQYMVLRDFAIKLEEKDISYFINKDREGGLCVCGYIIYVTPTNNMCPYCGWLWIVTEDGGMKDPTMIEERDNEGNYMWNGNKYSSKCIRIK